MKRRLTLIGIAAGLFAIAGPAAADEAADKAKNDSKISCRREGGVGSRLGSRLCMTRAQWRERARQDRDSAKGFFDSASREMAERPMNAPERTGNLGPN